MTADFENLFDAQAREYACYRPGYPAELFEHLRGLAPSSRFAWDAGSGSGQAARQLADYFDGVLATDSSSVQISYAAPHPRITYKTSKAHQSGLEPESCDLVSAASAVHWFDRELFFAEAQRVLKPGGIIAVWCYRLPACQSAFAPKIADFYKLLEPYWPKPTLLVRNDYKDIGFPFPEVPSPIFALKIAWTIPELLGYYSSWTAAQAYKRHIGHDPVLSLAKNIYRELSAGETELRYEVKIPICIRIGRKGPNIGKREDSQKNSNVL